MNIGAICEVMNQMMGASATALSQFLNRPINISPPSSFPVSSTEQFKEKYLKDSDDVVAVYFDLTIGDLVNSKFINVMRSTLPKSLFPISAWAALRKNKHCRLRRTPPPLLLRPHRLPCRSLRLPGCRPCPARRSPAPAAPPAARCFGRTGSLPLQSRCAPVPVAPQTVLPAQAPYYSPAASPLRITACRTQFTPVSTRQTRSCRRVNRAI